LKEVRTAINNLKRTNELASETTNRFSLITVIKWGDYQGEGSLMGKRKDKEIDNQRANEGQAKGKQRATNNNDNNVYNENNDINKELLKNKTYGDFEKIEVEVLDEKEVWFNLFWKEYPKKSAKKNAKSQFVKIVKSKETLDAILQDIRNRMNTQEWIKNNGQFIPFPSTYLNQERWTDEVVVMKGMSFLDIE
jgi:hypothetical protein